MTSLNRPTKRYSLYYHVERLANAISYRLSSRGPTRCARAVKGQKLYSSSRSNERQKLEWYVYESTSRLTSIFTTYYSHRNYILCVAIAETSGNECDACRAMISTERIAPRDRIGA